MRIAIAAALAIASALHAAAVVERGSFRLHKIEQPIGQETYRIERNASELVLQSDFSFRDRGEHVPLRSTLRLKSDYTPTQLQIKGKISRFSSIDETLTPPGFAIAGYAPISVQMALVRYWAAHGKPPSIPRTKTGAIAILFRGRDNVRRGDGRMQQLDRLTINGLIWTRNPLGRRGAACRGCRDGGCRVRPLRSGRQRI